MKLPLLLALLGLAGPAGAQTANGYELTGQSVRLANQTLYLLAPTRPSHLRSWPVLDSVRADADGRFVLRGRVPAPDVYVLRVGRRSSLQFVPLANQQERIRVRVAGMAETPEGPLPLLLFDGTPELDLLREFSLYYTSLRTVPVKPRNRELLAMQRQLRANASTYVAPYLAFVYLRQQPGARPLLDSLTERFVREQPASAYLPGLRALQTAARSLAVGAEAPDFTLPGPDGKPLALSSLRGKYVLVDFWASWCKPCRAENPNVLAAYQKYRDQGPGFTVLSVSLDERAADWQRALAEDALPWAQVADHTGSRGSIAQLYGITAIPATLLLDPQGRIVATDLRGAALAKELARYLR